jgi:hypothetical protein
MNHVVHRCTGAPVHHVHHPKKMGGAWDEDEVQQKAKELGLVDERHRK